MEEKITLETVAIYVPRDFRHIKIIIEDTRTNNLILKMIVRSIASPVRHTSHTHNVPSVHSVAVSHERPRIFVTASPGQDLRGTFALT